MIFAWWHVLVALIPMLPTFWSLWHIWQHDFNGDFPKKALWLVVTVFIPCIGGLVYIFFGLKSSGKRVPRTAPPSQEEGEK